MFDFKEIVSSVVSGLIVAAVVPLFKLAVVKTRAPAKVAVEAAMLTSAVIWKIARRSLFDTAVVAYFVYTLQSQLTSAEPLTRHAVFGIAAWTSITVAYVFAMLLRE